MRVCALLAVLACVGALSGCSESPDQKAASATVERFYDALQAHDAKTACSVVSPAVAQAMLRSADVSDTRCVRGMRTVFRHVSPHFFDSPPKATSAVVKGDRATVIIQRNYQRRHVDLVRVGKRWQISGSPDLH